MFCVVYALVGNTRKVRAITSTPLDTTVGPLQRYVGPNLSIALHRYSTRLHTAVIYNRRCDRFYSNRWSANNGSRRFKQRRCQVGAWSCIPCSVTIHAAAASIGLIALINTTIKALKIHGSQILTGAPAANRDNWFLHAEEFRTLGRPHTWGHTVSAMNCPLAQRCDPIHVSSDQIMAAICSRKRDSHSINSSFKLKDVSLVSIRTRA